MSIPECLRIFLFSFVFFSKTQFDSVLQAGLFLEKRVAQYVLPVLSFIVVYSKLPHKVLRPQSMNMGFITLFFVTMGNSVSVLNWDEFFLVVLSFSFRIFYSRQELRFILFAVPMLNVSAASAVARMYALNAFSHAHFPF